MNGHLCVASSLPRDLNPDPSHPSEALRDLDYLIRLNQRHRRLYSRLTHGLRFGELLAGALGIASALSGTPAVVAMGGGLLALVGLAGAAFEPNKRHHAYDVTLQRYSRLRAVAIGTPEMPLNELERRIGSIEDPDYIEALRLPSFNDMMRSHGLQDGIQPLNRWQRVCVALA